MNITSESRLSFGEATSIIIGHGIGSGILSIPFIASRNSLVSIIAVIAVVYIMNLLLHLMIAELSLNNGGAQFIQCFKNELFKGKAGAILTWFAFVLLGFSVIVNVSAFITGAAAVLTSWFGLPKLVGELIFYLVCGGIVFAGMKVVGICEKIAVMSMAAVIAVLAVFTFIGGTEPLSISHISNVNILALYSMVSFALSAVMSTPQVVKGLNGDVKKIRASIAAGTGVNLVMVIIVTTITLLAVGSNISENGALVDLSEKLGGWVGIIGYVFTLLALATSFWANTLNIRDIVKEQLKLNKNLCWAIASIPSFIIALLGFTSFVGFTRLASVVQVLTGVGVIIAYNRSRKHAGQSLILGKFGALPLQIIVIISSLAASVGSLVSIS